MTLQSIFMRVYVLLILLQAYATIQEINPEIFSQMHYSWKDNNPIAVGDLRCITVVYWGFDEQPHEGKLIVHACVAQELIDIFNELYEARYPIEKINFVDLYQADDEHSAQDNNTYSFCSRPITGSPGTFSKHSYGIAIDINPLYNPYHRGAIIIPAAGAEYLDRSIISDATITHDSIVYQAFIKRGWHWGGDWGHSKGYVDYHHFEKDYASP